MLIGTITILTILFFGGGGGQQWINAAGDLAPDIIVDTARADRAQTTVDRINDTIASFDAKIRTDRAELAAVDADYYATAEDYRRVFEKLDQAWRERMTRLIELRFEFRDSFTREEWDVLQFELREKNKQE